MNLRNIKRIMESDLWKDITKNEHYLNNFILDTESKENKRKSGQFFVLLVFFNHKIKEELLEEYHKQGARMSDGEGLDRYEPYKFYGVVKELRFS